MFDDTQTHLECIKSYTANDPYLLARALQEQNLEQDRLEETKSETFYALSAFKKLGLRITRRVLENFSDGWTLRQSDDLVG